MRSLFLILLLSAPVLFGETTLRLRNGAEIRGELVNPNLTLHAPYGSVVIATNWIAQLNLVPGAESDTLVTANGNRFSGYVTDTVRLRSNGEIHSYCHLEISQLTAGSPTLTNAQRFVVLVNGDVLSGEFTLPPLAVTNAAGVETLVIEKVHSLWFARSESTIEVQMADGKQTRVAYPASWLLVTLKSGGALEIPRELLKTIYVRAGAIPPEVASLARGTGAVTALPATREKMVWIPLGSVVLGSPPDERGRNFDEDPRTYVSITRGFWMAQFEVTQGEYAAVMGQNPSTFQGDTNRPVEKVSWHEALEYCARITESARQHGTLPDGYAYRLPTEAEWEYACRAGTTTRFSFGDDPDERQLPEYGWFARNSAWSSHPVGQLKPNPWGLYDMHGNVLEWCAGIWNEAYPGGQVIDYQGPAQGWLRVARGGSWLYGAAFARSANRDDYGSGNRCSDVGFRVVLAKPL